jgi:dGTPase
MPRQGVETQRAIYEINRRMIAAMIDDVVRSSRVRLAALASQSLDGVRMAAEPVIALSLERRVDVEGLQDYLFANVYRHPRVTAVMAAAETIVHQLFERYLREPALMPEPWNAAAEAASEAARAGVVADFVAGMTDRYAIKEHRRLFDATPELR